VKKQTPLSIGVLIIVFLSVIAIASFFYFHDVKDDNCKKMKEDLRLYVENKNFCNDVSECQIVQLIDCDFGLAGDEIDRDHIEEVFSEFYSPEGECWTGEIPECEDPKKGKIIACKNNKCVFEAQ